MHPIPAIYETLEALYIRHHQRDFIDFDPISIPHLFTKKEDIEIAGFWAAILAWGARPIIIRNAKAILQRMDYEPYQFTLHATESDLNQLDSFKHRTLNATDAKFFVQSLRNIYVQHNGLEAVFSAMVQPTDETVKNGLIHFWKTLFELPHLTRTQKHIGNIERKSAAKRINMYLRWMVRPDDQHIDFGLWHQIQPSQLLCPLDVHSGNVARELGLLLRPQNDWQSTIELTNNLKQYDPIDPIKYDFALFGSGVTRD